MKKILFFLALLLAVPAMAQFPALNTFTEAAGQHFRLASQGGNASSRIIVQNGMTQHSLSWRTQSGVSALTVSVSGAAQDQPFSLIASSAAVTGTINFTGTYSILKVDYTGYVGSGDVDADYYSVDPLGSLPLGPSSSASSISVTLPNNPAPIPIIQGGKLTVDATIRDALGRPVGADGSGLRVSTPQPANKCKTEIVYSTAISQTASARYATNLPGMQILICGVRIVVGAAEITSEWEGNGTVCATGKIAHSGSGTAASGESFAANGGYNNNEDGYLLLPGNDFCIGQSGSGQVSGKVRWLYVPSTR